MNGLTKGLLGAGVASLLAYGAHSMTGAGYIDKLETSAQSALEGTGVEGASLTMQTDPLARVAIISGVTDAAEQERIRAALLADGTLREVRFSDEAVAADDGSAGGDAGVADAAAVTGASEEQVADCQGDINTFMEGKSINFQSGSAYIAPESARVIDGLAERLSGCTGMSIAVGGHTDSTGSAAINDTLSQGRADAVAAALAERGVAAERITATLMRAAVMRLLPHKRENNYAAADGNLACDYRCLPDRSVDRLGHLGPQGLTHGEIDYVATYNG